MSINMEITKDLLSKSIPQLDVNTSAKRKRETDDSIEEVKKKIKTSADNIEDRLERRPDYTYSMMNNKEHPWMDLIRCEKKTVEGRVALTIFNKLQIGNVIYFHNRHQGILCEVTSLNVYKNFKEMITMAGVENLAPHICKSKLSKKTWESNAIKLYESFPGAQKVVTQGALAIGVRYICDYFKGRVVK